MRAPGYEIPVYAKPADLLETNPLTGQKGRGRLVGDFPPHHDHVLVGDRHVVLALAGRHARVAADAGVQVDRHPPLVPPVVGVLFPE